MQFDLITRAAKMRLANDEARSVRVVASTDAEDSYGEILEQSWNLDRYKANPVVLYAHNSRELPIGHASDVGVVDGQLEATLNFVTADANPVAEQVWQSIKQGSLRAVSVGFMPDEMRFEMREGREVMVLAQNELREISVVPVPANPEALAKLRAKAAGKPSPSVPAPAKEEKENSMQSLLTELGLSAAASEAEALRILRTRTGAIEKLLSVTGQTDASGALGTIEGWKEKADKLPDLEKRLEAIREAQVTADVDSMLLAAGNKVTPAERDSLRAKGLQDPAWLKGYLAVKATAIPASAPVREPASTNQGVASTHNGKTWSQLKPMEKADLFLNDRAAYEALKAAAQ